jgi:hypothetical protein
MSTSLSGVPTIDPDDLLDSTDVAELLGLARYNAVSTYRQRYPDFPAPLVAKGRCRLWRRQDVEAWAVATRRRPTT